jgi:hypothetical protein
MFGQSYQRQATITGNGSFEQGQCVIEVQVDASAEVQVRGTAGVLTNAGGQAPQWLRFECTGPMPLNPTNFKYSALAGRGEQQLTRDPTSTGVAIVRMVDKSGGSASYAFRLEWQGFTGNPEPFGTSQNSGGNPTIFDGPANTNASNNKSKGKGKANAMSNAEAVETCQQEIMRLATQRFNTNNIYFRRTATDNRNSGQNQVRGTLDVNANNNSAQRYRFSCNVNLNNGRVRSAQIDNSPANQNTRDYGYKGGNYDAMGVTNANRVIQACEAAFDRRLSEQGLQHTGFGSVDVDERAGSTRVLGTATVTDRNQRQQTVDFACNANLQNGTVSSVDMIPRR